MKSTVKLGPHIQIMNEKVEGKMERKKRILFIVEAMGGGVFTYIVNLANELSRKYDMYIAYAVRPQTPANYKEYFNPEIHLIRVKNFTREINPRHDLAAFFEIRKIAKQVKPDIIHLHSSKAGAIGRFAFDGKDVPVFYTPHGYSFLMKNYSSAKQNAFHAVEQICAKRRCTTISCSKGENDETLKMTKRAVYVSNGINISELQGMIDGVKKEPHAFTVFTIGRIDYQKNPEEFNEIANRLPDVRFLWIGDGKLRNKLTAPNIEITGWMDRKEVISRSMNADVLILPSLWEGLPMSLLESMYMRKPCIVSDVIGNRDVIQSKRNGYVCRTTEEFVNAIEAVRTGKSKKSGEIEIERLVNTAFQDVIEEYNTTVMAEKYSKFYENSNPGGGTE